MTICTTCGREDPSGSRFCSGCGAPLARDDGHGETRRVVTIVFTDVVGSTTLGEQLDPESLRSVMSRYFAVMAATLERHGGTVEKFIGDAVMAVFGIPRLHEDDALRALRAALAMRDELATLNEELERDYGVRIATRTGVNTGAVVAGVAADRQRLVTGDPVNVAARLQQAAAPGEILLGGATFQLTREVVQVEQLPPLELAGRAERLSVCRLRDVGAEVPTFSRRLVAPFVGRTEELARLVRAFRTAERERACGLATIVGPPGIGKSRLARELIAALQDDAQIVVGRCLSYGEGITYWPLAEIARRLAGPELERGLRQLIEPDRQASAIAARIAGAIGSTQVAGSPEETAWAFRRLFETLARDRPLLLVVDDIHWAEPTLLDLLEYLLTFATDAPILILGVARPELFDTRPTWAAVRPRAKLISLEPLADHETLGLIDGLVRDRQLAERVKAGIVGAADGNPLFVEQILAHQAEGAEGDVVIPPNIQALLAARIDRLNRNERAVLECASVEGRQFHRGAVAELMPSEARSGIGVHLISLIRKEFLRPDRGLFPGDDGFRFNHILIRDAAYESMPRHVRAERHERYAEWLEERTHENVAEFEEILGYHLEQACRCWADRASTAEHAEDLAVRAAERLGSAGRAALKRGDIRGAVNLLSRATALPSRDRPAGLQFLPDLAEALSARGEHSRAAEALADAAGGATAAEDEHTGARARLQRAWLRFHDPKVDVADVFGEAMLAVDTFGRLRDERGLAHAWHLVAWINMTYGQLSALSEAVERGLAHARAAGDALTEEELTVLEILAGPTGPSSTNRVSADAAAALDRARANGSRYVETACLIALAMCAAFEERFDAARGLIAEAKGIEDELGGGRGSGFRHWPTGMIEMTAGDAARAETELRASYETLRDRGETWWLCGVAAELADVLWLQGRDDEAFELTLCSEELAGDAVLVAQMMWRGARAKILARRGYAEEAEALAREGLALMAGTEYVHYQADAFTDLAEVLRLQDRLPEAVQAANEAERLYEQKGNVASAKRLRALVGAMRTPRNGSVAAGDAR